MEIRRFGGGVELPDVVTRNLVFQGLTPPLPLVIKELVNALVIGTDAVQSLYAWAMFEASVGRNHGTG